MLSKGEQNPSHTRADIGKENRKWVPVQMEIKRPKNKDIKEMMREIQQKSSLLILQNHGEFEVKYLKFNSQKNGLFLI